MSRQQRPITDREIQAWLAAGAADRGVGEGLTFVASTIAARAGKASWILCCRLNGRSKEKALGRYPELALKDADRHAHDSTRAIDHLNADRAAQVPEPRAPRASCGGVEKLRSRRMERGSARRFALKAPLARSPFAALEVAAPPLARADQVHGRGRCGPIR